MEHNGNEWNTIEIETKGEAPEPRTAHSLNFVGDNIIVFAGNG